MMMKEEEIAATENSIYGVGYGNLCSMFNDMGDEDGSGGLGFLEMLGVQDNQVQIPMGFMFDEMSQREVFLPMSTFDYHNQQVGVGDDQCLPLIKNGVGKQFDDVSNLPGTPNSSSISSASNNEGAVVESELNKGAEEDEDDEDENEEEEEHDQQGSGKRKKQLKAKKANLKRQKQPRFAFMTKSEVDHLEDGYRWRKYGQKAVKNSPFPRSYYRCTSASCGVKKRVERSCTDSSIVVTTYEGQHTHPSPLTPRSLSSAMFQQHSSPSPATLPTLMQMNHHHLQQQQQQLLPSSYFAPSLNYNSYTNSPAPNFTSLTPSPSNQSFFKDHGLLQDLIPSVLAPKK